MTKFAKISGRRKWLWAYAPLIIWVGVVLGLGSGFGAANETSRIIRPLLEFLFPSALPETLTLYHGYIRKFAHFAEYAVLGFLACRALAGIGHRFLFAFLLVVAVAAIDEFNQSYNPARTGSPVDAMIDMAGGLTATLVFYFLNKQRNPSAKARAE